MAEKITAPYGTWKSPISAGEVARIGAHDPLTDLEVDEANVYWLEIRPLEGGRHALMRWDGAGEPQELLDPSVNVRTSAHEYGGGAFSVAQDTVFFVNYADQRLYRRSPEGEIAALTPEPPKGEQWRFAEPLAIGEWLVAVRERHAAQGEVFNELVALPLDGLSAPHIIAEGHDFYSSPAFNPADGRLAWLTWDHPNMPWDGSDLWVAGWRDGALLDPQHVAGGPEESIFQPAWSPQGVLHFISDRSGWWNLYRWSGGQIEALAPMEADFGFPQWEFGVSRYTFTADGTIACVYSRDGVEHLGRLSTDGKTFTTLDLGLTAFSPPQIACDAMDRVWMLAASFMELPHVLALDIKQAKALARYRIPGFSLDREDISLGESIGFPTQRGREAYALYYPPCNAHYQGPEDERPPLIVMSHGGPTAPARSYLRPTVQYWTTRGFAVVDVNYGGSTGFGRAYRQRLQGSWGLVDTEDCINAAKYLAGRGLVDGQRLAIRGGSAGGFTTLSALTFHDVFAAGASYYGVADLEALTVETHKFESRYLDGLVGPYPEAKDIYDERSPICHTQNLSCPMLILQGLEDKVVPPAQAEAMVEALKAKGIPYAYCVFPNEGHGFLRAENVQKALETEYAFYAQVFGFEVADEIEAFVLHVGEPGDWRPAAP